MSVSTAPRTGAARGASGTPWALHVATFLRLVVVHMVVIALLWIAVPVVLLGYDAAVITSGSMQPAVRPGDVVLSLAPDSPALQAGTIVRFRDGDRDVTHRISGHNADGSYLTRGDANGSVDSDVVAHPEIDGVARMVVPAVGLPAAWLHQGRLLPLMAVFGLLAIVLAGPARSSDDVGPARRRQWRPSAATLRRLAPVVVVLSAAPVLVQPAAATWSSAHPASSTWSSATLAATAAVRAAGSCTSGASVVVDWDAVTQAIDGYDVYRKSSLGSYELLTSVDAATTSHVDATVIAGATYTYAVVTRLASWSSAMTESPIVIVPC